MRLVMSYPIPNTVEIGASPFEGDITIYQGQVPNIGFRLKDQNPDESESIINLGGYGAIMQVRGRVDSNKVLLEASHCHGLVFDVNAGVIWFRPKINLINELPTFNVKREWVYDLILEQPTGGPVIVARGKFIVIPVVTRVDFGNNVNDVPRPPSIFEVIIPGIQGADGLPGEIANIDAVLQVSNKLSELSVDTSTQLEAQANLGLSSFDPLAYYILAKA